ncbi:MAG: amino acid racemase [Crocosphaera sp.]|nr:amino acid racemase [Crocosphaera sp.]
MKQSNQSEMIGILGGMGPLASAEFLKTIYEYNLDKQREQEFPKIIVYSDPSFPDRTEVFLKQDYHYFLEKLIDTLSKLCQLNVSKIIICCITSHYLLPQLPDEFKKRIISLIDIIMIDILKQKEKHLLICSKGTKKLEIFQNHEFWPMAKNYLILLDEEDQNIIHQMIYHLKVQGTIKECFPILESLKTKYNIEKFVVGCTEIHLLSKYWDLQMNQNRKEKIFLDPLTILARTLPELSLSQANYNC